MKLGMKKKNSELNDREAHLIEQLRERPELMERFEAILGLTECENGPVSDGGGRGRTGADAVNS